MRARPQGGAARRKEQRGFVGVSAPRGRQAEGRTQRHLAPCSWFSLAPEDGGGHRAAGRARRRRAARRPELGSRFFEQSSLDTRPSAVRSSRPLLASLLARPGIATPASDSPRNQNRPRADALIARWANVAPSSASGVKSVRVAGAAKPPGSRIGPGNRPERRTLRHAYMCAMWPAES